MFAPSAKRTKAKLGGSGKVGQIAIHLHIQRDRAFGHLQIQIGALQRIEPHWSGKARLLGSDA